MPRLPGLASAFDRSPLTHQQSDARTFSWASATENCSTLDWDTICLRPKLDGLIQGQFTAIMTTTEEGTHICADGTKLYTKTWKVTILLFRLRSKSESPITSQHLLFRPRSCLSMVSVTIAMHIMTCFLPWPAGASSSMPSTNEAGVDLSQRSLRGVSRDRPRKF